MQYVCSDIHGRYDKWRALLNAIDLRSTDTVYVLGDMIDRGPDGIKVLQDMMVRSNVVPILGNHELTAAVCLKWLLKQVTEQSLAELKDSQLAALTEWIQNGGGPTIRELSSLTQDAREDLLDYLQEMDLYAQTEAGGNRFVLTHAGIDHFDPRKHLEDYSPLDFLLGRSSLKEKFWQDDRYLVYGHTPTRLLRKQLGEQPSDEILRYGQQIAIDCGCGFDGRLGCLCLDTLEEFYV